MLPTSALGKAQSGGRDGIRAPAEATVRCDMSIGDQVFASRLSDVSRDGSCALIPGPAIPLRAGTRLERVRVRHAQAEPFVIDLEVRHVTRIALPDGRPASRVVCKLLASREVLEDLIRLFIIAL